MWKSHGTCTAIVALVLGLHALMPQAASRNFAPDVVFTGSRLTGWHPLGQAEWRAENGEIIGTPKADGGGWLMLDRSLQDVALASDFRCAAGCKPGILLRAEKTPDGGLKGIFVSLAEGDLGSFRVTLDAQGKETSRERLRPSSGDSSAWRPRQPQRGRQRRGGGLEARPAAVALVPLAAGRLPAAGYPAGSSPRYRRPRGVCARATGTTSSSCSMPTSSGPS